MMSYLLDKMLGANDDGNNLGKFAPLVIFFVIWLVSAISKAKGGKKGEEKELPEDQEKHELGFDDLAHKIRERYQEAKEQAKREAQQGENEQFQPPVMAPQPKPPPLREPEPMPVKKPIAAPSMYAHEGPTLKVVKGLQQASVGDHLTVEKPTMLKVDSALQKVDAITSENAKVSADVEIIHHQYLSELAEQYATQNGFRKAILNYEILGPPISLRE
jgi:hypothetical protein